MKKVFIFVILLFSVFVMAEADEITIEDEYEESFENEESSIFSQSLDDSIELREIIPSFDCWGQSVEEIKKVFPDTGEYKVGKKEALIRHGHTIEHYNVNVYYVFSSSGLYKIVYVISDENMTKEKIKDCWNTLAECLKTVFGEPDSATNASTIWYKETKKIEIGTGRFEKYKGTNKFTVGIIVTNMNEESLNNEKNSIEYSRHNSPYTVTYFQTFIRNKEYIKIEFTGYNIGIVKRYDEKKRHATDYGSFVGNLDIGMDVVFNIYKDPVKLKYSKAGDDSNIDWINSDGSVMCKLKKQ